MSLARSIIAEAKLAEQAGFPALYVKAANGLTAKGEYTTIDNQASIQTIQEVRKVFSGELGANIHPSNELNLPYDYYKELDFLTISTPFEQILFNESEDDIEGMKTAWKNFLQHLINSQSCPM